jgi:hypothetical protein
VLQKMANSAMEGPMNLLRANKETIVEMNKGDTIEDMNWQITLVPASAG